MFTEHNNLWMLYYKTRSTISKIVLEGYVTIRKRMQEMAVGEGSLLLPWWNSSSREPPSSFPSVASCFRKRRFSPSNLIGGLPNLNITKRESFGILLGVFVLWMNLMLKSVRRSGQFSPASSWRCGNDGVHQGRFFRGVQNSQKDPEGRVSDGECMYSMFKTNFDHMYK